MPRLTPFLRPLACCLAWAMVAVALWPAVSQVWVRVPGQPTEVCSAQGARWVQVDPAPAEVPEAPGSGAFAAHCPACPAPAQDALVPAVSGSPGQSAVPVVRVAGPGPEAVQPPSAWRWALSRGPPG